MRIVIFEDEMHNAERLIQLLHKCNAAIQVVAVITSVEEGIRWLEQQQPVDLMLMDIQLSDGNCFEIFSKTKVRTPIIFTTAYDEYALENSPAHLITALTSYEDQHSGAFKKKAEDPELQVITQWMVRECSA